MSSCPQCDHLLTAAAKAGKLPAACPACKLPLHTCRNCGYFDPRKGKGCNKVVAPPKKIDAVNTCDEFRLAELLPAALRKLFAAYQGTPATRERTAEQIADFLVDTPFLPGGHSFTTAVANACRREIFRLRFTMHFDERDVASQALLPVLRQLAKASRAELQNPKFRLAPAFASYFIEPRFSPHLCYIREEGFGDSARDLASMLRAGLADAKAGRTTSERMLADAAVEILDTAGYNGPKELPKLLATGSSQWTKRYREICERAQSEPGLHDQLDGAIQDFTNTLALLSSRYLSLEGDPGEGEDDERPALIQQLAGPDTEIEDRVLRKAVVSLGFGEAVETALAAALADPKAKVTDPERWNIEIRLLFHTMLTSAEGRSARNKAGEVVGLGLDARALFFAVVCVKHPQDEKRLYERFAKLLKFSQRIPRYLPQAMQDDLEQRDTWPLLMLTRYLAESWRRFATPEELAAFEVILREVADLNDQDGKIEGAAL